MNYIPYARQSINNDDIQAVVNVLKSDWLTQGPVVEKFERAVADYCGAKYAVTVNSATTALHIACLSAGLGQGDTLWTTPNTFVASANCGLYCGASVDFVDIDDQTYNMSVVDLEKKLARAHAEGNVPKLIIPVHFAGQSCEMDSISRVAKKYGVQVIEDASHAIGGSYLGHKIGGNQFCDMTVLSFHPVKIITSGEGGIILTNREDLYEKLIRLRSHGITRDPKLMEGLSDGPWYYQQIELGFNYRITDLQSALGLSQLARIDKFVARRKEIADRYNDELGKLPIRLPWQHPNASSAWHLYVIRIDTDKCSKSRRQIFEELRNVSIGVNVHYIPVHTQPYYRKLGFKFGDYPKAERYYQECISLPMYYDLSQENQDYVINSLKKVLR